MSAAAGRIFASAHSAVTLYWPNIYQAFGTLHFAPYILGLHVLEMFVQCSVKSFRPCQCRLGPTPVLSACGDLGYMHVVCFVTQHWHIKGRHTRQKRREERLSDSCLHGWVTLLQDPLRGAKPWVTSVPQSGRKDFKHKTCTTPQPTFSSLFCCSPELHRGSLKSIPAVTTS